MSEFTQLLDALAVQVRHSLVIQRKRTRIHAIDQVEKAPAGLPLRGRSLAGPGGVTTPALARSETGNTRQSRAEG